MDKKVIWLVGMHNKPGKTPLCSSTKSGKLLDRAIKLLPHLEFRKTNLFNIEHFPDHRIARELAPDWLTRNLIKESDVIILLGACVHQYFPKVKASVLKYPHPASQRSHVQMNDFVKRMTTQLTQLTH